jgi:hypothetical protein
MFWTTAIATTTAGAVCSAETAATFIGFCYACLMINKDVIDQLDQSYRDRAMASTARRSFWIGAIMGICLGIIIGFTVGKAVTDAPAVAPQESGQGA